jgi:hypothetical protein
MDGEREGSREGVRVNTEGKSRQVLAVSSVCLEDACLSKCACASDHLLQYLLQEVSPILFS